MENEVAFFWMIVLLAFVTSAVGSAFLHRRRRPLVIRQVRGYQTMPLLIDEAIEGARRTSVSIGGVEIGQNTTVTSLAALSLLYELSRRQSFTASTPLVTTSDGIVLLAAGDMVRRAYAFEDNADVFRANSVVWLPAGSRSVAFGAGVAVLNSIENVSSNVMLGAYGAEVALVGDASARRDTFFIGQSTQMLGQAVAYVFSDAPLIGEELFVSDAYMRPTDTRAQVQLLIIDVLRWALVAAIVLIAILNVE